MKSLLPFLAVSSIISILPASSAIILFDLLGKAGSGLISGNQNSTVLGNPGSGGEFGAGIFFDDVANVLTVNVAWGTGNGFTNLTGLATAGHIHGPTASGGTASFTQDASVIFNLDDTPAWNPSASGGAITNRTIPLNPTQKADLFAGRYYINIHTGTNGAGEIRGNLVPEPGAMFLGIIGFAALVLRHRING